MSAITMQKMQSMAPASIPITCDTGMFLAICLIALIMVTAIAIHSGRQEKRMRQEERRRQEEQLQAIRELHEQFRQEFGVPVPPQVTVSWFAQEFPESWYLLTTPSWTHSNQDGTRDKRYSDASMNRRTSVIQVSHWQMFSCDPIAMNDFVIALRAAGNRIPLCADEKAKMKKASARSLNEAHGTTPEQIYHRFADDSTGFEHWCAQLLRRKSGASVRVTPPTNDGGYDLDIRHDGKRTIAECKCYDPNGSGVGRPLLQKLIGANAAEGADTTLFMTTSRFTKPAREYAKEQGMYLLDGQALAKMSTDGRRTMRQAIHAVPPDAWKLTQDDIYARYPADLKPEI